MHAFGVFLASRRGTSLAPAFLVLVLVPFFQIARKYLSKPKSVLPPELESKRVSIATRHNQIVVAMLLALFVALFSLIPLLRTGSLTWTVLAIATVGIAEVYGIRRILKYDDQMCERQ